MNALFFVIACAALRANIPETGLVLLISEE
jgi:hypothetical protein